MALRTGELLMTLFKRSTQWKEWNDVNLNKFKQELLEIADDFIEVCERYHLTYVMSYGTALGAARHKGFVPWDDDLDLNMPRADFDIFLQIAEKEMGDKYYVRAVKKGDHISVPTIHLRKKYTHYINYGDLIKMQNEPEEMRGIYIDIAAFENAPNNILLRQLDGIINLVIQFIMSCVEIKDTIRYLEKMDVILTSEEKSALRLKKNVGLIFSFVPAWRWYKFYDWYASKNKNDQSKYVCSYAGYKNLKKSTFERIKIFPTSKTNFEGRNWNCPNDLDYYLKTIYSDYMKLPPLEKRKVHPVLELQFSDGTII